MALFGDRLKVLRKSRKLSLDDFAEILGLSKSSVHKYERGEREPSLETMEAIADYFNVDMDYLYGRDAQKKPAADESDELLQLRIDALMRDLALLDENDLAAIEQIARSILERRGK